jgi:hypothetical protein
LVSLSLLFLAAGAQSSMRGIDLTNGHLGMELFPCEICFGSLTTSYMMSRGKCFKCMLYYFLVIGLFVIFCCQEITIDVFKVQNFFFLFYMEKKK